MRQALVQSGIHPQLWSIFLPQLDQMEAKPVATPFGVGGRIGLPQIEGWFWGCAAASDCLVTTMGLSQRQPFTLVERPELDYYVLTRFTPWDANLMNKFWSEPLVAPLPEENVAAFFMSSGAHEFPMVAGSSHGGCTISMLPSFVERELGEDAPRVMQAMREGLDLNHVLGLRAIMRSMHPERALRPGAMPFFRAKVLEALSELTAHVSLHEHATGGAAQRHWVATHVRRILRESLAQPPSLDALAQDLGISRTTLCAQFKTQTGMTVGACLTSLRIEEAQERLRTTDSSVAQIAAEVGYTSQAAFSTAFKRTTGMTPLAWRQEHRGSA